MTASAGVVDQVTISLLHKGNLVLYKNKPVEAVQQLFILPDKKLPAHIGFALFEEKLHLEEVTTQGAKSKRRKKGKEKEREVEEMEVEGELEQDEEGPKNRIEGATLYCVAGMTKFCYDIHHIRIKSNVANAVRKREGRYSPLSSH